MRLIPHWQLLSVAYLFGCASSRAPAAGTPIASRPVPVPIPSAASSWTFNFTPGSISYRISRTAAIDETTGPQPRREISTNSTHESLTLQTRADTVAFTAVVDTFATTTQGMIDSAQAIQLPLQLSGVHFGDSLTISADSLPHACSPVTSALITDLHNLLPRIPALLTTAVSWKDSTNSTGCQGSIPTRSRVLRSYHVIGESEYEGVRTLVLQRADTIQAEGEGAQQQHRLTLTANGTGSATYYQDTITGSILHLSVSQDLDFSVTVSGKTSRFRQTVKQEFALAR